jgi:acyl carrier protein
MTETCAGSSYSKACPSYDLAQKLEFANLGTCIPGLEMRIMRPDGTGLARTGAAGHLQVFGTILFDQYFNNLEATQAAFTADGWFETGYLAYIDEQGNLNLPGRIKDTIIVNGVKWSSTEIETAIEEEGIAGLVPFFTVAFPHRAQTVSLICGKKPDHLIPLPAQLLEKSSLGKISRTQIRAAFEKGEYASFESQHAAALARHRATLWQDAETKTEQTVQDTLAKLLNMSPADISLKASIFELGVDSSNLITLKAMLQKTNGITVDIPISILSQSSLAPQDHLCMQSTDPVQTIHCLHLHGNRLPTFEACQARPYHPTSAARHEDAALLQPPRLGRRASLHCPGGALLHTTRVRHSYARLQPQRASVHHQPGDGGHLRGTHSQDPTRGTLRHCGL